MAGTPTVITGSSRGFYAELAGGLVLLFLSAFIGIRYVHRPQENSLDRFAFRVLSPHEAHHSLGLRILLATGGWRPDIAIVLLTMLVSLRRDWRRSIGIGVGAILAVLITERLAKPLVGGDVAGFGGHSYPSGTITAVTAYAVAIVLILHRRARLIACAIAVILVSAVGAAVIIARWHFATDVVGGICVGAGAIATFDALAHLFIHRPRRQFAMLHEEAE